ncbi:alpha/beta-hydrolase [Delitschia confertaspora ATCC 74209]|uniref:Alpha/beta-hydrolase n=1 Tax=Delitschia confertaspora ATCC 74209 TaxID=1513339 RepID=A0A9P4JN05_9PLEO|nr:alpha/beta-hydrolase [Delitschia confertaspora ATCC 74209]
MAATTNPLHNSHSPTAPPISTKAFTIAGVLTTVYGLDEVPSSATSIACLWLLHPRLQTHATMAPIAASTINAWNARKPSTKGLIAVSFDQRNHGTRLVSPLSNEAWRQGNPRHAQDMFSSYHGTSQDTSLLITYLPSYIFNTPSSPQITQHLVLGVSLGGHAAWHCILHDPRITAAVVGIGCPDYTRLMMHRAEKSKLKTWTSSSTPGSEFLGSEDFPKALIEAVKTYDPAGLLLSAGSKGTEDIKEDLVRERLEGKAVLNLSGADDKLVPYAAGEPFVNALKGVIGRNAGMGVRFEDRTFEGVGHAFSKDMVECAVGWICDVLGERKGRRGSLSKI